MKSCMKKLFPLILLILTVKAAYSAPLAAVSYISYNSQRAHALSVLFEQHHIEILKKNGFETINQGQISREIEKNSCFEESCLLRFAWNAEIDLMISGSVEDRGDYISVTLKSYGTAPPYNSRLILSKTFIIPAASNLTAREFSLICEENSALFIASTLRSFVSRSFITQKDNVYKADGAVTGRFNLYFSGSEGNVVQAGECSVKDGIVEPLDVDIPAGAFILIDYFSTAQNIEEYYADRKREIVFQKANIYDTLFIILTTPVASATMPFAAPLFGYYTFGDWSGMGLWALNAWPYMYIEAKGFIDSPENLKKEKRDITRDDRAANYFAWYMALAGGMSLFMDAYAHQYLKDASLFIGQQRFLGSNLTAGYLALVCNGGGQFYKGHRGWGYFYFHINNALLYMTLREASRPEHYDETSGRYIRGKRNTDRALVYGTALAVSKIVEITHTLLTGTDLESAETVDEYIIPGPLFTLDSSGSPVYGLCLTLRY